MIVPTLLFVTVLAQVTPGEEPTTDRDAGLVPLDGLPGQVLPAPEGADAVLELSLPDAIASAFAHNLALQRSALEAASAAEGFGAAWGAYDSVFFVDATRFEEKTAPTVGSVAGSFVLPGNPKATQDVFTFTTGFRGLLETGTTWQVDLSMTSFEQIQHGAVNSRFAQYTGDWGVSLTHPFLRGSGDFVEAAIDLAVQDVLIAAAGHEVNANDTIRQVIEAYWNLVFARQDLATRELSVALAEELLAITNRKYEQGLQNRIDVIENEAEVARRREERLTALNSVDQTTDDLFALVFAPQEADEWVGAIEPVTSYEQLPDQVLDLDTAVSLGLDRRPDLRSARASVERAEVEVVRAENQASHRLDLTAAARLNNQDRDLTRTARNLTDERYNRGSVTLNYELPIGNRAAEFAVRRRQVDLERSKVQLREAELAAIAEIRQAERNVALQQARVVATAETTRLRREVYEGEKRRLENDLSTPYEVRQNQRDLLEAIDAETRARLDLAIAMTGYRASQGTLLELFGYVPLEEGLELDEEPELP